MNKVSPVTLSHRPDRNTHDVTGHADLAQVYCLHHFPGHQHEQRSQQQLERARGTIHYEDGFIQGASYP